MSSRPSPLPNRVTPFGDIVATPERMEWMGNRGIIHRDYRIVRRAAQEGWVICRTAFKGRRRELMSPGRYTELFFLDEATALAAGHRPCFECRREEARRFSAAWGRAAGLGRPATAGEMNAARKRETAHVGRRRAAERARLLAALPPAPADLPPGAMVAAGEEAWLWDGARFLRWSFGGYAPGAPAGPLRLLTPPSAVAALAAGYAAQLHPSAAG